MNFTGRINAFQVIERLERKDILGGQNTESVKLLLSLLKRIKTLNFLKCENGLTYKLRESHNNLLTYLYGDLSIWNLVNVMECVITVHFVQEHQLSFQDLFIKNKSVRY